MYLGKLEKIGQTKKAKKTDSIKILQTADTKKFITTDNKKLVVVKKEN